MEKKKYLWGLVLMLILYTDSINFEKPARYIEYTIMNTENEEYKIKVILNNKLSEIYAYEIDGELIYEDLN